MEERAPGRPWLRLLMILALGGAAYLTNLVPVPLSFGLHFLLGGLFAILAAIRYGPWAGAVAAAIGAIPTLELWGHPYALLSMTLEAWVVGLEAKRGGRHYTETNLLYWLLVGGPLVLLTYSLGANIPFMASGVSALKQAVNGLVNTSAASVLMLALLWWQREKKAMPLEAVLSTLITFLVLSPLAFSLTWMARENGQQLRTQLSGEAITAGEVMRAQLVRELADRGWPQSVVPGELEQIADRVLPSVGSMGMEIVVTDGDGQVLFSSWEGVAPGAAFVSDLGQLTFFHVAERAEGSWLGPQPQGGATRADVTSLQQAERLVFVHRSLVSQIGWQIYVRKPLGVVEYTLYRSYLSSFLIEVGLIVLLLITIRLVTFTVTRPLVQLAGTAVSAEGELTALPPNELIWVAEVRAVILHLDEVGQRIKGLIRSLQETQRKLEQHNVELAVANLHLADEALRDAQTGLHNRRAFWQQVQLWVEQSRPFTLLLIEVQGRLPTEVAIKGLAAEVQHSASLHGGEVYRYGSARFACLFPESSEWLVDRMVRALPSVATQGAEGQEVIVGASRFPEDGQTGPTVVEAAERRLLDASRG